MLSLPSAPLPEHFCLRSPTSRPGSLPILGFWDFKEAALIPCPFAASGFHLFSWPYVFHPIPDPAPTPISLPFPSPTQVIPVLYVP